MPETSPPPPQQPPTLPEVPEIDALYKLAADVAATQVSQPTQSLEQKQPISRREKMEKIYTDIQKAAESGRAKDEAAIHQKTEAIAQGITNMIRGAGGTVETGVKAADKIARGAEMAAKLSVQESWQIVQEVGVRSMDGLKWVGKTAFTGAKWGAVGAVVLATSPVIGLATAGVGLYELGAHGVKKLSEGKQGAMELSHKGAAAVAAGLEAAKLAGAQRQGEFQIKHDQRVKEIRDKYPLPRIIGAVKTFLK